MTDSIYDISVKNTNGEDISLSNYKGKVLIIVNTASQCGFTPQLGELEEIYERYHQKGLEILGFPCNQFLKQEPKNNEEIVEFCSLNYGVKFPILSKIDVNGENQSPLFKRLKNEAPGILGTKRIKWNFTKFLISRTGEAVKRFPPNYSPKKMTAILEKELEKAY